MFYKNIIRKRLAKFISGLTALMLVVSGSPALSVQNAGAEENSGTVYVSTNLADGSYEIQMLDGTIVGFGSGVNPIQHVLPASEDPGTGYKIIFEKVEGFTEPEPNPFYFNLLIGEELHFGPEYGIGVYMPEENPTGTVNINTNLADGSYTIYSSSDVNEEDPLGSGVGVNPTQHILPASEEPGTGYKLVFGDVAGFITPETIFFNLITGDELSFEGIYDTEIQEQEGTVNVSTNIADGSYAIYSSSDVNEEDPLGSGGGVNPTQHILPASEEPGTGYKLVFHDVEEFITPENIFFNLITDDELSFEGIYTPESHQDTGIVNVSTNITEGAYVVYYISDGTEVGQGGGLNPIQHVLPASEDPGTGYQIVFDDVIGYITPNDILFNLIAGDELSFEGVYTPEAQTTGTVNVNQNGAIGTVELSGPSPAVIADAGYTDISAITGEYTLTSITAPAGYELENVTDENGNVLTDPYAQTLVDAGAITYNINYVELPPDTGTVIVNQNGAVGAVELSGPSPATVNGATYSDVSAGIGEYTLISIAAPAGYELENVTDENGNVLSDPYAQTLTDGSEITYDVNYRVIAVNVGTVNVNQIGANGTVELSGPTPATITGAAYSENNSETGDYTLTSITAPAGYDLTNVTDENGNVLTEPYAQTLTDGGEITYNVSYAAQAPIFSIVKSATFDNIADNNKRVYYTIIVTRHTDIGGQIDVVLSDTITGAGSMSNNNGVLNYVMNSFEPNSIGVTCEVGGQPCSQSMGIAEGNLTLKFDSMAIATIRYEMLSDNRAQPSVATFTNTATATYTNPNTGLDVDINDSHSVSVNAPSVIPDNGCVNCGGGGGGGHTMFLGDMELLVEKLVSLDGKDYRDAGSENLAIIIPENKNTRLYNKVRITNPGEVSAKNVEYKHFFDTGESDMTAGDIENLQGAEISNDGNILIKKIKVNETAEFTYSILISENGKNSNPALDGLELMDFGSALPNTQDGLNYAGIGDQFVTYIYAGQIPGPVILPSRSSFANASDVLNITVTTDKAEVRIGDIVNYTITLENISDTDMSNLYISHNYPVELSLVNTGGGRDNGRDIQWRRPLLRPAHKVTYSFTAKVVGGSTGSQIHSITRAMVNEFENISPVDSYLTIVGGTAVQPGQGYSLAQTGPAGILILMILSALSYFGFGAYQKRRYLKLKKESLRF